MFGRLKKKLSSAPPQMPFIDENLVDIGGELNPAKLLKAYRSGSFPWSVHPVTWWSPDPRAIIEFDNFHASRSLLKLLKKEPFQFTTDTAFSEVIKACAQPAPNRRTTWITPEFIQAYTELHKLGHAHSLEVWSQDRLAGGIYGVAIGGYFAAESMFHRVSNASKAALVSLVAHLKGRGYELLDVQMPTQITLQMGATVLERNQFLARMRQAQALAVAFK